MHFPKISFTKREMIALFRIRYHRGNNLVGFVIFLVEYVAYAGAIILAFGFPPEIVFIVPFIPIAFYVLGWIDQEKGFMKFENEYPNREINPQYKNMEKGLIEIEKYLNITGKIDIKNNKTVREKSIIIRYLVLFRIRMYRGKSLVNFITDMVKYAGIVSVLKITFGIPEWAMIGIPLLPITFYLFGWLDQHKGLFKFEQEYGSRELNPFWSKMELHINRIQQKLKKEKLCK